METALANASDALKAEDTAIHAKFMSRQFKKKWVNTALEAYRCSAIRRRYGIVLY